MDTSIMGKGSLGRARIGLGPSGLVSCQNALESCQIDILAI